jgi:hypothetical protein
MDERPADELLSNAEILTAVHEVLDRNPRATVWDVNGIEFHESLAAAPTSRSRWC